MASTQVEGVEQLMHEAWQEAAEGKRVIMVVRDARSVRTWSDAMYQTRPPENLHRACQGLFELTSGGEVRIVRVGACIAGYRVERVFVDRHAHTVENETAWWNELAACVAPRGLRR